MQRVYLVRHAQSAWNGLARYQGWQDSPLTEEGYVQVRRLARRLEPEPIEVVHASTLGRALKTAQPIARHHGVEERGCDGLREMSFGQWEGLTFDEIQKAFPDALDIWLQRPVLTRVPGGESLSDMASRCWEAFREILESSAESVVVVSHGGPIRALLCRLTGSPLENLWRFRVDNASISVVDFHEGSPVLSSLNETCHLF